MKSFRIKWLLILHIYCFFSLGSQEIKDFYPCEEGSLSEYELVSFIEDSLKDKAIPYRVITYKNKDEIHSFSRSLEVNLNPLKKNRLYLALSLNGSSPYSYINTEVYYNLIEYFHNNPPQAGVSLLFLGGERNSPPVGSSDYLSQFTQEESSTLIFLDVQGGEMYMESSISHQIAPLWLIRELTLSLDRASLPFIRDDMRNILSRTGLTLSSNPISPWLEREIPSLYLTGFKGSDTSLEKEELISSLTEVILDFTHRFPNMSRDNQEINYLPLSLGLNHFLIGETHSIQINILLLSFFILITVFQSRNFRLNLKRNKKNTWVLALIFSLVFIFLYLSSLIVEEMIYLKNMDDLWLRRPRDILYFKLLLTLLFSSFFLFIIRGLPLPRKPHFYSYGAVLFAMANMVILVLKDISLVYYALWLYFCLFLFLLNRKIIVKTLITIIMPLPILLILTTVVIQSYPDLTKFILLDRIAGNLVISAFLMPQILLLTSLHFSRYYYHRERRSFTALGVFLLVPAAIIFILFRIILFNPLSGLESQQVIIMDTIDYNQNVRTIELSSPQALGKIDLSYDNREISLSNLGNELLIKEKMNNSYLSYEGEMKTFLDRKRLLLTLNPEGNPQKIEIFLHSYEDSITVYDCNFPYFVSTDNREIPIGIGKNPQLPLILDLTLTADSAPMMRVVITYQAPPLIPPTISNKPVDIIHGMTLIQEFDLSPSRGNYVFPLK